MILRHKHCRAWTQLVLVLFTLSSTGTLQALGQNKGSVKTQQILFRMDKTSRTLKTMTANLKQTKVTVVVNDVSEENGRLFYRKKRRMQTIKIDYEKPNLRTLLVEEGKIKIIEPRIKRYQEYNTSKAPGEDKFHLFWFGKSSSKIQKDYYVNHLQDLTIDGKFTSLLELRPKSIKIKAMFTRIQLWIDHQKWIPIKTRLFEASEDHLTIVLSNIKINPRLSAKTFKLTIPSDYERVQQEVFHSN